MKNMLKRIKKTLYYITIILVVITLVNNSITRFDKVFNIVGFRPYTILTGSMEPKIMPGDMVLVRSIKTHKLAINDVITFEYNGKIITHRIVKEAENGFITKGDNNNVEDNEVIPKENVIGKVSIVIPKIGFLIVALYKPYVMVGLLLLLIGFILKETFSKDNEGKKLIDKSN